MDYFKVYMVFYTGEGLEEAKTIAEKYVDFPVVRWQQLFTKVYLPCRVPSPMCLHLTCLLLVQALDSLNEVLAPSATKATEEVGHASLSVTVDKGTILITSSVSHLHEFNEFNDACADGSCTELEQGNSLLLPH